MDNIKICFVEDVYISAKKDVRVLKILIKVHLKFMVSMAYRELRCEPTWISCDRFLSLDHTYRISSKSIDCLEILNTWRATWTLFTLCILKKKVMHIKLKKIIILLKTVS